MTFLEDAKFHNIKKYMQWISLLIRTSKVIWQQIFGTGLVGVPKDCGACLSIMLYDWVASSWDGKAFCFICFLHTAAASHPESVTWNIQKPLLKKLGVKIWKYFMNFTNVRHYVHYNVLCMWIFGSQAETKCKVLKVDQQMKGGR